MPTYLYICPNGTQFDRYLPVSRYKESQICECCGEVGNKVITVPNVFVSPDICYDSPIDGRPITSKKAREEDLARSNCVPYDPEIKKDYQRRIEREEKELDRAVDATIDKEIALMPARKREKLEAELQAGFTVTPERRTAPYQPIKAEIEK
jgi:hypothetical protein